MGQLFFRWSAISKNNLAVGRRIPVFNSAFRFEYDSIVLCAFAYQGRWKLSTESSYILDFLDFSWGKKTTEKLLFIVSVRLAD